MKNPPRTTTIKGQKHLLAYITPDEAKLLKAMGGSGEKVNGVPAFYDPGGTADPGQAEAGGFSDTFGGYDGGADDKSDGPPTGISPGQSQAQFGTTEYAGLNPDEAIAAAIGDDNDFALAVQATRAKDIKALQDLNRQLQNLSRRERIQQNRLRSPLSLIPGVGMANYLGLQNVRNLASAAIGQPPGLMSGLGFGDRNVPGFTGLGVSDLIGLQGQAVTNPMGDIVGFRDEYGNVQYGQDPDQKMFDDGSGPEDTVPASTNPVTGEKQCPDGYMFDEDLQACRLAGGLPGGDGKMMTTSGPYEAGDYARMGLLDIAPMGMSLFADRYGIPQMDFDTSNLAFRRGAATRPQYFKQAPDLTGYTLLS